LIECWLVGIGGITGAIARVALGSYIGNRMGSRFPHGTFVINFSGIFSDRFYLDHAGTMLRPETQLEMLDFDRIHQSLYDILYV